MCVCVCVLPDWFSQLVSWVAFSCHWLEISSCDFYLNLNEFSRVSLIDLFSHHVTKSNKKYNQEKENKKKKLKTKPQHHNETQHQHTHILIWTGQLLDINRKSVHVQDVKNRRFLCTESDEQQHQKPANKVPATGFEVSHLKLFEYSSSGNKRSLNTIIHSVSSQWKFRVWNERDD